MKCGLVVEIQALSAVKSLADYNAVVLGTALYMFRLHKDAHRFLARNRETLLTLPMIYATGKQSVPGAAAYLKN